MLHSSGPLQFIWTDMSQKIDMFARTVVDTNKTRRNGSFVMVSNVEFVLNVHYFKQMDV
jgi:hypothetical protein